MTRLRACLAPERLEKVTEVFDFKRDAYSYAPNDAPTASDEAAYLYGQWITRRPKE